MGKMRNCGMRNTEGKMGNGYAERRRLVNRSDHVTAAVKCNAITTKIIDKTLVTYSQTRTTSRALKYFRNFCEISLHLFHRFFPTSNYKGRPIGTGLVAIRHSHTECV